eukprot:scaffold13160_cov81-Phaeocystis_antarctica.AAC.8
MEMRRVEAPPSDARAPSLSVTSKWKISANSLKVTSGRARSAARIALTSSGAEKGSHCQPSVRAFGSWRNAGEGEWASVKPVSVVRPSKIGARECTCTGSAHESRNLRRARRRKRSATSSAATIAQASAAMYFRRSPLARYVGMPAQMMSKLRTSVGTRWRRQMPTASIKTVHTRKGSAYVGRKPSSTTPQIVVEYICRARSCSATNRCRQTRLAMTTRLAPIWAGMMRRSSGFASACATRTKMSAELTPKPL